MWQDSATSGWWAQRRRCPVTGAMRSVELVIRLFRSVLFAVLMSFQGPLRCVHGRI